MDDRRVAGVGDAVAPATGDGAALLGARSGEAKGITGGILQERQYLHGVRARGLDLDAFAGGVARVPFGALPEEGAPGLYRGTLAVGASGDARLALPGWTRGFAWINGFGLGRYWSAGPQQSLYVPGPVLREGANELWLLELERTGPDGPGPRLLPL